MDNTESDLFQNLDVLVTGGAGFLGSWICDVLVRGKARVTCLDNLSTVGLSNIEHLMDHQNFEFVRAGLSSVPKNDFDLILHAAGVPAPDQYMTMPVDTLIPNALGLQILLEFARKKDAELVFFSTSEVYGDAEEIPTPETSYGKANQLGTRSCYGESKRFGETLCASYNQQYGTDTRIVRIFNSYGPRMDRKSSYARVVPKLIKQAITNQDMTVYGDGTQTRSFCYVTDTVRGILKVVSSDNARREVFNLGNPHEVRIIDLTEKIRTISRSNSDVTFWPLPQDDPKRRCPDISKAERLLDWRPVVKLDKGIEKTLNWFLLETKTSPHGQVQPSDRQCEVVPITVTIRQSEQQHLTDLQRM